MWNKSFLNTWTLNINIVFVYLDVCVIINQHKRTVNLQMCWSIIENLTNSTIFQQIFYFKGWQKMFGNPWIKHTLINMKMPKVFQVLNILLSRLLESINYE